MELGELSHLVPSKVIGPSQSAFLPGRYILEGAIVLHETLHELKKKMDELILKLDFEKAYDKVNWSFLQHVLRMKGRKNGANGILFL